MGKTTRTIRIALTAGDPLGIGPEVIAGSLGSLPSDVEVTIYGDPAQFPGNQLPANARVVPIHSPSPLPAKRGPNEEGGRASLAALDAAIEAIKAGKHDALVTAPISKEACVLAGGQSDGHTAMLARAFATETLMTFVWDEAEPVVALLTHHIPLRAVPAALTSDRVEIAVRRLVKGLASDFGKQRPHIGVLGLNPHAGEGGRLGTEEEDFVVPALIRLREAGFSVDGPLPGDATFAYRDRYDAILALYHDQGLAPVKALAFDRAVNVTFGLPFIRTSPAHGTAFGIAGRGEASPTSMQAAIHWAVRMARQRLGSSSR